ncbi:unnamed protein product [Cylindrotheca closterium]|uniref:Uncharacterized protein n=1 Tax=Cylindrotheca closterium TaxID=2856 RepID=A0AAD2G7Y5_9STRA|nr:unnamed protein product [Cylindrotheca closterium]
MKLIVPILILFLVQADASKPNHNLRKDTEPRRRHLISFSAFDQLLAEGGAEIASDGSSPTLAPVTSSASNMEARTTLTPTVSPTKITTLTLTVSPTDKPTTDAPPTSSPTDRPTTDEPSTSSPSTSAPTTSKPTDSPPVATSATPTSPLTTSEPTKNPTTLPATSIPTTAATPIPTTATATATPTATATATATPSYFVQDRVASTRTSSISLEVKGEAAPNQDTLDSICSATQTYVNTVTKRSFGKSTVTTLDCNVSMGQVHATAVTKFPDDGQAPDAITYDDYIQVVMISDETISTLPSKISEATSSLGMSQEVKAAVDTSVHPPVLQLSFEELHDSAVTMRPTFTVGGAIIVAFFTVLLA